MPLVQDQAVTMFNDFMKAKDTKKPSAGVIQPKGMMEPSFLMHSSYYDVSGIRIRSLYTMNFRILREMARKTTIIAAIQNVRLSQIRPFTRIAHGDENPGYQIRLRDREATPTKGQKEEMKEIALFFERTGLTDFTDAKKRKDRFPQFIEKLIREHLTLDQNTITLQPDRSGRLIAFHTLDGSTIHPVSDDKPYQGNPDIRYVQRVQGRVVETFKDHEMLFHFMNHRADLVNNAFGYCLPGETRVLTDLGYLRVEGLPEKVRVWTGKEFAEATVFETGTKRLSITELSDGSELRTSPDHRIRCVDEEGRLQWVAQSEVEQDDWVVSSPEGVGERKSPTDDEVATGELLGWFIGDGSLTLRKDGVFVARWFYHRPKEADVYERHIAVMKAMGLHTYTYSIEKGDMIDLRIGYREAKDWVVDEAGIPPVTAREKDVPDIVWQYSSAGRCSFLRGLFSADGHVGNSATPILSTVSEDLARSVQLLLKSVGIRSGCCCQKNESNFSGGTGVIWQVHVKDREKFRDTVGFLQAAKNDKLEDHVFADWKGDVVAPAFAKRVATVLVGRLEECSWISGKDRSTLVALAKGTWHQRVTRKRLTKWVGDLPGVEREIREALSYTHIQVVAVEQTPVSVPMYDLSVEDKKHQFVAEGVIVHNSYLEQSIDTITGWLFGMAYNKEVFNSSAQPKGFFSFNPKQPIDPESLQELQRQWIAMFRGIKGMWKVPFLQYDAKWNPVRPNNSDMEYSSYIQLLSALICAVHKIDPQELGLKFQQSAAISIGGGGSKARQNNQSHDRGLQDLLTYAEDVCNRIMERQAGWEDYEFDFTGKEIKDENKALEIDTKRVGNYMTLNELRKEHDMEPLEYGDVPLNATFIQYLTQKEMMAEGGGGGVEPGMEGDMGGMGGAEAPGEDLGEALAGMTGKEMEGATSEGMDEVGLKSLAAVQRHTLELQGRLLKSRRMQQRQRAADTVTIRVDV